MYLKPLHSLAAALLLSLCMAPAALAQKTSALSTLTSADTGDYLEVLDVSDTTMAVTGTNKKITFGNFKTALSLQPLDTDLTSIAALATTSFGRGLLEQASASAARTTLGLAIGSDVQAYDADLTTYGGITPSTNVQTLLGAADYSAFRSSLGLVIGTNVQAYDADLTTFAGITPSANVQTLLGSADYSAFRTSLGLGTAATQASTAFEAALGNPAANGYVLSSTTAGVRSWIAAGGTGTVTSVGLTVPSGLSVTGSPVTASGTLAISTTLSGVIKGTGSGFTAATADTDYLTPGTAASIYQPLDADLTDLADGTLTGSKVGTGINGDNVTSGTVADARIDAAIARDAEVAAAYQPLDADLTDLADGSIAASKVTAIPFELIIAISDETTAVTAGTNKVTFRMPFAGTLTTVRASAADAPTGSTLIVDINEAGTSVLSTKLSIDATEKTSTTAASAAVISDSSIADDAEMTIDLDQVGATTGGKGIKVLLKGTRN